MEAVRFAFMKSQHGGAHAPLSDLDPILGCEVKEGIVYLTVDGHGGAGLMRTLQELTASSDRQLVLPYEDGLVYDTLRRLYAEHVGTVWADVTLQKAPNLHVEETELGWCVLKLGGDEYPNFEGLADRLRNSGHCDVQRGVGRDDLEAVFFRLSEESTTSTLNTLTKLKPVLTGNI